MVGLVMNFAKDLKTFNIVDGSTLRTSLRLQVPYLFRFSICSFKFRSVLAATRGDTILNVPTSASHAILARRLIACISVRMPDNRVFNLRT